MRKTLFVLAALLPLTALASLPAAAVAAAIVPDPSTVDAAATNCGTVPDKLPPSSFDVISATPITGHLSINRGCGGDDDEDGIESEEHEGSEGEDD